MLFNAKGGSRITTLMYLLIISLAIYIVVKIVPVYYAYYSLEDEVRHQLHLALINPQDVILDDIYQKAQYLELPIKKEDITLTKDQVTGKVSISLKWAKQVDFGYGIKRDFPFEINANNKEAEK